MSIERLQQLAEGFESLSPSEYEAFAGCCRDLAINRLDVRFMVLGECFHVSSDCWGSGDGGAVTAAFANALARRWDDYLPGILSADTEETGTALALALKDELELLRTRDPLTFEDD